MFKKVLEINLNLQINNSNWNMDAKYKTLFNLRGLKMDW